MKASQQLTTSAAPGTRISITTEIGRYADAFLRISLWETTSQTAYPPVAQKLDTIHVAPAEGRVSCATVHTYLATLIRLARSSHRHFARPSIHL